MKLEDEVAIALEAHLLAHPLPPYYGSVMTELSELLAPWITELALLAATEATHMSPWHDGQLAVTRAIKEVGGFPWNVDDSGPRP